MREQKQKNGTKTKDKYYISFYYSLSVKSMLFLIFAVDVRHYIYIKLQENEHTCYRDAYK